MFSPQRNIEVKEQTKLLGLTIQSNLKWKANTESIVKKAYKKLWLIRRLKKLGASRNDLLDMYIKQVRCQLEYAAPVWHHAITLEEKQDLERVQKSALRIIFGSEYETYDYALNLCNIQKLETRRDLIGSKFATKSVKHKKNWFVPKPRVGMRNQKSYITPIARTERLKESPIYSLINIMNQRSSKK